MIIAWLKGTALPLRLHAPPGALYIIKAPSSVHQMASYYFYPVKDFHEIDGFLVIAPKPEVIERYCLGVKYYVPLALSNGLWMRAIGLPVLVGHRRVCFFVFCPPCFLPTSTGHSFRATRMKNCRHITLGGIQSLFQKFWGSDPPGGNFFPNFLLRYRSENVRE